MTFPPDFLWGVAAAAYQVEGAAETDGRGPSVWDMFSRRPGATYQGHTGDVACDHYHRYRDDVALMRGLGVRAYRLSLSWPRVLPHGTGALNERGLDFYDRLVDSLLEAGITPWVTLFHWDFPYELYLRGGWLNPDSPHWFADYTDKVVARLGDRVRHWFTHNEPQCFLEAGHRTGAHAPGDKLGWPELLRATHNVLLAHGRAVQAIRATSKLPSLIGYAPVGSAKVPASEDPADIAAAREVTFRTGGTSLWSNAWFSDPIFLGRYPADGLAAFGAAMPPVGPDDMALINQPIDFFGVNIYHGATFRATGGEKPELVTPPAGFPTTAMSWPVTPDALYWGSKFLYERYGKPIYITENGMANLDWVSLDGRVRDPQRIDYMARYLRSLKRAIDEGIDVRGYFYWSIMDNFEWAEGYNKRFGLVHVDYQTQTRTLKDSAHWYRRLIASNGGLLEHPYDG